MSTPEERADAALEMVDNLCRIVADIAHRLAAVEAALPPTTPGETRSDYRFDQYPPPADDAERTRQLERIQAAWQRLHEWVDWLVATYRLTAVIPPCWPEHPTITEELIGLRIAWVGAWSDRAPADAINAWHERLSRAKTRLSDGNWGKPRCDGTHDPQGLDMPAQYSAWTNHPTRAPAYLAAHQRTMPEGGTQ
ncbi:hypothetical protein [Actinokineospora sp. NPDC004072]